MNEYNEIIKRFTAIEDELVKLRKQRNYELFNLDENNIPRLRAYSQLISENKQAISLVEQNVSDVESSVTLLSQFTSFDNVAVVEASDDKTGWDKSKVYYDSNAEVYWYHDGTQWRTTDSPVTAGLDTSIAQIQAKAAENEAAIALVAKSVTQNTEGIIGLQELTGNIDSELTTVKTNLAAVETKADDAAASAELAAQSVTELENEVSGQITTLSSNIASVKTTADSASASVSAIVSSIGSDGSVTAASIVAKINSAGSAVQIAADHISLKGKTIALTSDSIDIASTYFNVATSGAVTCTSLSVTGNNSSVDIAGSNTNSALIKTSYYNDANTYSYMSPQGLYVNNSNYSGSVQAYQGGFIDLGYINGYQMYCSITPDTFTLQSGATNSATLYAYSTSSGSVWGAVNSVVVNGTFAVNGSKSKLEQTEHYGNRLMYAFESPNPLYSDFGRASIADDGLCYVFIDPVFYECIDNNYDYFVFIQPESSGEFTVVERTADHFIVQGTPGTSFAWMLVTAQKGYSATRTEELIVPETDPPQTPDPENAVYDAVGDTIMNEYESQLG